MRCLVIACGILAIGLLAGCKKDDAGAGATSGTNAAPETTTGSGDKGGPMAAPGVKEETTGGATAGDTASSAPTKESVAGLYDSVMDEATQKELDKAGQHFSNGTMQFNADGTFEGNATIGKQDIKTKGTFTVEGTTVTTTATEINGQENKNPVPQKYTVSADGKELSAEGTGVTLVKK